MVDNGNVANGDHCTVIAGTHKGKAGTVEDWNLSKTGQATITVRLADGDRIKPWRAMSRQPRPSETAAP